MTLPETRAIAATIALTLIVIGCGGTESSTADGGSDAAVIDAGGDAANIEAGAQDSDVNDSSVSDGSSLEDAGADAAPVDSSVPCPGGDPPDAGTTTIAETCSTMCASYFPLCIGAVPNCQMTCENLSSELTPSQAARVRNCVDIDNASECPMAMLCASQVTDCP